MFCFIRVILYSDDVYDVPTTTPEPPGLDYNLEFKIVDLGENFAAPKPGTQGYEDLSNSISDSFEPLFKKIPGYKRIVIEDLKEYVQYVSVAIWVF